MKYIQIIFGKNNSNNFQKNIPKVTFKVFIRNLVVIIFITLFVGLLAIFTTLFLQEKYFTSPRQESSYIIAIPFLYGSLILTSIYLFFNKKMIKEQFASLSFREVTKHVFILSLFFTLINFPIAVVMLLNDPQNINEVINEFKAESSSAFLVNYYADILVYISIWLLVGFGEEIFFRGVIYRGLRRSLGIVSAITLSTIIFVLPHFPSTALDFLRLALFGAVTAWYYEYKNNLLTISILHLIYDLIIVGALTYLAAFLANFLIGLN